MSDTQTVSLGMVIDAYFERKVEIELPEYWDGMNEEARLDWLEEEVLDSGVNGLFQSDDCADIPSQPRYDREAVQRLLEEIE